jgi:hypothetical protein
VGISEMMKDKKIDQMFACAYDAKLTSFPLFTEMRRDNRQENILKNRNDIRWLQFPASLLLSLIPDAHNHYYLYKFTLYPLQNQKMLGIECEDKTR